MKQHFFIGVDDTYAGDSIGTGALFGGLRYLTLTPGFHHTPDALRLFGHLGFGLFGSVTAFGLSRVLRSR